MDSKIHARLTDFVARMQDGPLGRIPLDRAIKADLTLFRALRETGATWAQIANALTTAGARRPDGGLITADHIRSAVSRQLRKSTGQRPDVKEGSAKVMSADTHTTTMHAMSPLQPPKPRSAQKQAVKTSPTLSSDKRAASVLEKLARTRKLRE